MIQLLVGLGATLGLIGLSIAVPLLVGAVILWIVGYVPLVGRRGRTHARTPREGVAAEYPSLPPRNRGGGG